MTPPGIWNDLEIRVVGQHYTVIRNGEVINEFENLPGVPFPGRPNDPDSSSRGLVGYVGLQAHGAPPDVVSFRDIRVRACRTRTDSAPLGAARTHDTMASQVAAARFRQKRPNGSRIGTHPRRMRQPRNDDAICCSAWAYEAPA